MTSAPPTSDPGARSVGWLPPRLIAPEPGWTVRADVIVVGSGVAGLTAALHAARSGRVLVVTKALLAAGSTRWAQGGIAAALDPADSPAQHQQDTEVAGVGLCDPAAVAVLVREGPARVRELIALGARFDTDPAGELALAQEGGHRRNRIAHAGGDATGAEVQRALVAAVSAHPDIDVIEHALVLDLLRTAAGRAAGVTLHVLGEGRRDGVGAALGRAVVLATGGMGQVYAATTNPPVSTGDGVALALRAGATVRDVEFVQFHPTALWLGPAAPPGQQPLVSEALRGEGAVLVDGAGARVLDAGVHPLADLAPRDVVTRAMSARMAELGTDHLYLDARALGAALLTSRFPTILARCRAAGIEPVTEPIPVIPAAHYASGGIPTDLAGRTDVPQLYACGEVACTGVHGANRLASNSLLEGLVFAARIGADLAAELPAGGEPELPSGPASLLDPAVRSELTRAMSDGAGVLRSAASLEATAKVLATIGERTTTAANPESWEVTDLHTVATVLVAAALRRQETRGSHWREDFPVTRPQWRGHISSRLDASGQLDTSFQELS